MRKVIISPSLLAADFKNLLQDIKRVDDAGAEWLHFDVMDGHFVPNISFGVPILKSIADCHNMLNDVHIMVSDPLTYGPIFALNGADLVTFHYEAMPDKVDEIIASIKDNGARVGISLKPCTDIDVLLPYLEKINLVLIMSVEPGFGGQSFKEGSLDKIKRLRKIIDEKGLNCLIEVDGGINEETAKLCIDSGVDVLVAGSYIFGHQDVKSRIDSLRK